MKWLALLLLAFLAVPALAQEEPKPDYYGAWTGTIGKYPVVACLSVDGFGDLQGAYYYRSQLKPIGLSQAGQGWQEESEMGAPTGATWNSVAVKADILTASWRQGKRSLAVRLQRTAWTAASEYDGPCMSDTFLSPRTEGSRIEEQQASLDGWNYVKLAFRPPASMPDVAISSFAFAPREPGDMAINAKLRADLPDGSWRSELMQCMGQAIQSHGSDGEFEFSSEPSMVSRRWFDTYDTYGGYCGGAHPSWGFYHRTFDRQTGEQVDLLGWLVDTMTEHVPGEGPDELDYYKVLPPLRELILKRAPDGEQSYEAECREYAEGEEFWSTGLSREGISFSPSVPHALGPCATTFTVPWQELGPFLSKEGDDGRRALRED